MILRRLAEAIRERTPSPLTGEGGARRRREGEGELICCSPLTPTLSRGGERESIAEPST